MATYSVIGREVINYEFIVEAGSKEEAHIKAKELQASDWLPYYTTSDFNITETKEIN